MFFQIVFLSYKCHCLQQWTLTQFFFPFVIQSDHHLTFFFSFRCYCSCRLQDLIAAKSYLLLFRNPNNFDSIRNTNNCYLDSDRHHLIDWITTQENIGSPFQLHIIFPFKNLFSSWYNIISIWELDVSLTYLIMNSNFT